MINDFGHWTTTLSEIDIDSWVGFIYRITNLENGMMYIGRKQFHSINRKKIANRVNRKKVIKESNWKTYTSSSSIINQLINDYGKDKFKFEIIELCRTKAELVYREVEIQWEEKVLSATLPNGERKYYNGNIGSIKFRLDKHSNKTKEKMSVKAQGKIRSISTRKKMSESKSGIPKSAEHRRKLSEVNLHKELSEETKEKIGIAHRGKETKKETKEKMSKKAKERKYVPAISCIIDGIEYDSLTAASISLAISTGVLKRRILSPNYSNYTFKV